MWKNEDNKYIRKEKCKCESSTTAIQLLDKKLNSTNRVIMHTAPHPQTSNQPTLNHYHDTIKTHVHSQSVKKVSVSSSPHANTNTKNKKRNRTTALLLLVQTHNNHYPNESTPSHRNGLNGTSNIEYRKGIDVNGGRNVVIGPRVHLDQLQSDGIQTRPRTLVWFCNAMQRKCK